VEKALVTDLWAQEGADYGDFPHPQQVVPLDVHPALAVALITLKETLSCLDNSDVQPGQSLAIVGTGPVGQALTLFARLLGIRPLVVFGRRPEYLERFAALGADAYVTGDDFSPLAKWILWRGGFDRAIEAVGSQAALTRCLQITKPDGRVNLYGVAPDSAPYLSADESDPRVFRSPVVEAEAHDQVVAWVRKGRIRLADWVSHVMPWRSYARAFEMVHSKQANKIVLTFD
jgi:threonine dehydrogenase-like Zn-dependent dehydrogenase